MNAYERFRRVADGAPMRSWNSYKEQAQYHYFNKHGALQRHRAAMKTLLEAAERGVVNSGWLISCDVDYHEMAMIKLIEKQRVKGWDVRYHTEAITKQTEELYTRLGEVIMGKRDKAGREI